MDTSKEYIEMCRKALEIQALAKRDSYFADLGYNEDPIFYVPPSDIFLILPPENNRSVWLPRQDQLQDMMNIKKFGFDLIHRWVNFSIKLLNHTFPNSMEQLWLAFVMQEKYEKTWNGKEWIMKPEYWYVEFNERKENVYEWTRKAVCIARHPSDWIKCKREFNDYICEMTGKVRTLWEITGANSITKEDFDIFIKEN